MPDTKNMPRASCVLVRNADKKILAVTRGKGDCPKCKSPERRPGGICSKCSYVELCGLPGGKVEPGETCAQAAARELREETGLTGQNFEFVFGDYCHGDVTYWVATYTADVDGTPTSSHEGKVMWVEPSELIKTFTAYNTRLFDTLGISYTNPSQKEGNP